MSFRKNRISCKWFLLVAGLSIVGCSRQPVADEASGEVPAAELSKTSPVASQPEGLVISGRVTMDDGQPLRGVIKDVAISIHGVSEAGERVHYAPAVKPDGAYRQKVVPGQYGFNLSRITVLYNGNEFALPLEPVGNMWNKNRDAAEGITQDFVWKVTGATPYGQSSGLDPANATHWYGMSIELRPDGWRQDINQAPKKIPEGTKLTFKLNPTGKSIDDRQLKPVEVQREYSSGVLFDPDLNDLVPAPYDLSGSATLPDGATQPLLFQGRAEYPGYKPVIKITVEKDNILGGMWKPPCTFIIE